MGRNVVDPAVLASGARNAAEKISRVPDMLGGFRVEIAVLANRQDLHHLNALEVAPGLGEGRQQRRRLAHARRNHDGVSVHDDTNGVSSGEAFLLVLDLKGHGVSLFKRL